MRTRTPPETRTQIRLHAKEEMSDRNGKVATSAQEARAWGSSAKQIHFNDGDRLIADAKQGILTWCFRKYRGRSNVPTL